MAEEAAQTFELFHHILHFAKWLLGNIGDVMKVKSLFFFVQVRALDNMASPIRIEKCHWIKVFFKNNNDGGS